MSLRHPAAARLHDGRLIALLLLSGLLVTGVVPSVAAAQVSSVARPIPLDLYAPFVAEAAQRFGVPITWIRAVMRVESRNDRHAISPKGAMGLMPATWASLRVRYGLGTDPFDPRDNILAGAAYLREMHDRYGAPGFLAAYNAGPGRYEAFLAGRPLPAETLAYVTVLGPLVGGENLAPSPTMIAALDPLAWTRSPPFIAPTQHVVVDDRPPPRSTTDNATTTAEAHDMSAIAPISDGLFVPRREGEAPR